MEGQPEKRMNYRSDVCKIPSKPNGKVGKKGYGHLRPRTIFMAVSLTFILTTGLASVWMLRPPSLPPPPPPLPSSPDPGTPHGVITIDGDANFSDTALLEGWDGDGSLENPYIIDGLDIDRGGEVGHCIIINNTRVSFTISNCNLTGANITDWMGFSSWNEGAGIHLLNVSNGELVNNTCNNNGRGIYLYESDYNTVANNTCNNNDDNGISLGNSDYNTVANNTCTSNEEGIYLWHAGFNTVANNNCTSNGTGIDLDYSHRNTVINNICNSNGCGIYLLYSGFNTVNNNTCFGNIEYGISLSRSDSNTVSDNTCNSNDIGISLDESSYNTLVDNTCNDNRIGIYLGFGCGYSNIVVDNTCLGNTEHDITEESGTREDDSEVALLIGFVGFMGVIVITLLGGLIVGNRVSKGE